jgi:DNA phosphorothioation-dependent restriction protein DptG
MLDINRYNTEYHLEDGIKFKDNWTATIRVLPFNLNPSTSGFDKNCGLSGITGAFFRKWGRIDVEPIQNYKNNVEEPVSSYLQEKGQMNRSQQQQFMHVVEDILYPEGKMSVIDATFLPYIPLVEDTIKDTRTGKKYIDGQKKLSDYLYSMLLEDNREMSNQLKGEENLFSKSIREGMQRGQFFNLHNNDEYYILPFIKHLFKDDLKWLMDQEDYVIVKNAHYLLHFYACLSISQTIAHIVNWKDFNENDIIPFYYMLSSESASESRDVVCLGWEKWISRDYLQNLLARAQALDIFNTLIGDKPIGLYSEIISSLGQESFLDNKSLCERVLSEYHKDKYDLLKERQNINKEDLQTEYDYTANSYEEFFQKLTHLCIQFQSPDYKNRLEKKVRDLFEVKFLRNRRGMKVLVLDEDILIFLIAMVTKEQRMKLDEMYNAFHGYGIFFDMNTRIAIEAQLSKLNLLDKKSDSGEAQYVRVVL